MAGLGAKRSANGVRAAVAVPVKCEAGSPLLVAVVLGAPMCASVFARLELSR